MKCNRCGCDDCDDFRLVDDALELYLCPSCGSADVDTGAA